MVTDSSVKVAVRIRPLNSREQALQADYILHPVPNGKISITIPKKSPRNTSIDDSALKSYRADSPTSVTNLDTKTFSYDYTYWSTELDNSQCTGQGDLFNDIGSEILQCAFQGFNTTMFAYGQTGSGKTYSMMGTPQEKGIIPRLCEALFTRIESEENSQLKFKVEVTFFEIFKEKVRDLLRHGSGQVSAVTSSRKIKFTGNQCKVREHPRTGPYVEGLSTYHVTSAEEMLNLLNKGNEERTTAATAMNERSSRSHSIFTIKIIQTKYEPKINLVNEIASKISMIDLAGSERSSHSNTSGERLKEGALINKSLTTLGLVIKSLAARNQLKKKNAKDEFTSNDSGHTFIPYRDSILTWLLKDSLGGNSKTFLLATLSPASTHYEETLSTLRYAHQAKSIINSPLINEDPKAQLIRDLQCEVDRLSELLRVKHLRDEKKSKLPSLPSSQEKDEQVSQWKSQLKDFEGLMDNSKSKYEQHDPNGEDLYLFNGERHEHGEDSHSDLSSRPGSLQSICPPNNNHLQFQPHQYPHLIDISQDSILFGMILCFLPEGKIRFGSTYSDEFADVFVEGHDIYEEHAIIYHEKQSIFIEPANVQGCSEDEIPIVRLNGSLITSKVQLFHGDRVEFGESRVYRFNSASISIPIFDTPATTTSLSPLHRPRSNSLNPSFHLLSNCHSALNSNLQLRIQHLENQLQEITRNQVDKMEELHFQYIEAIRNLSEQMVRQQEANSFEFHCDSISPAVHSLRHIQINGVSTPTTNKRQHLVYVTFPRIRPMHSQDLPQRYFNTFFIQISIPGYSWVIRRKYKEMEVLYYKFKDKVPSRISSLFPNRIFFLYRIFSPWSGIDYRRNQLERWFNALIEWQCDQPNSKMQQSIKKHKIVKDEVAKDILESIRSEFTFLTDLHLDVYDDTNELLL